MKIFISLLILVAKVATLNHYEENLLKAYSKIAHDEKLTKEWNAAVEKQKSYKVSNWLGKFSKPVNSYFYFKVPNWPFNCQTQNMSGNPQNGETNVAEK